MKRTYTIILTMVVVALFASAEAFAQSDGDFRSAAKGDWSAAATWETFDGTEWQGAAGAPDGSENITIVGDTVFVDTGVAITGSVVTSEDGVLEVEDDGSLTFEDGSTYEHARDGGSIPESTWATGSTASITGVTGSAPSDRGQDYYNLVLNTPDKTSNVHMGFDGNTVSGDITVVNTGSSRWYLMSASSTESASVEILGDVNVEDGEFAVQGTGNALTTFTVDHYGDINVTGGNFSIARGSQGNGSGTTTWNLFGDFNMADAESQNSNPDGAKFVFANGGTQVVNFSEVDFGSRVNYDVTDSTTLEIADGTEFVVSGVLANYGEITTTGDLTIDGGGTYEHARDGGDIPDATWSESSTAIISGTTGSAPGNRGQDYHHLTLNTPDKTSNTDLDLDGNTISGDVTVVSTGSSRWYLLKASSGESATVDILGNVYVEDGQFGVQGTGNGETTFTVNHYGNVSTSGGNFSPSRGSQGGTGTTTWNFFGDSFSVDSTTIQNSNSDGTTWVFAKGGTTTISLSGTDYSGSALQMEVSDSTTLDLGSVEIGSGGDFTLNGTIVTSHADGVDGNLQTSGEITFDEGAGFLYNGSEAQVLGDLVFDADSVGSITISNEAGVSINDTVYTSSFNVTSGIEAHIDTAGSISVAGGSIDGAIVNEGEVVVDDGSSLAFGAESTYEHGRDGGDIPTGTWAEGSTALLTGTEVNAPANRGQDYYNLTLNTPDLISNVDLSLHGNTVSGDIHIVNTGIARWYLTSPSGDAEVTREVTLLGDVTMEQGQFSTNGSGNPGDIVVHHYGSVIVNDGNFSISRGSQASGTSSSNWFFYEGDFTLNGGKAQSSNPTNAQWVFAGSEDVAHTLAIDSEFEIEGSGMQIIVSDSSSLDLGSSEITSGGDFTAEDGATLLTSHVEGFDGNLQNTGNLSISTEGNYTYNGTEAQATSFTLPLNVHGLTIDNEAGVTQSRDITINGFLRLANGEFDNSIGFVLGVGAEIIYEEGSLVVEVSSEPEPGSIPDVFALKQNYPNPFNPTTKIQYDVPEQSNVSIKVYDITGRQVAELVNRNHTAGVYTKEWDASQFASGMYIYRISAGDFTAVRKLTLIK